MKFSTPSVYVSSLQHLFHFLKREPQYLRGSVTPATMEKLGVVLRGCLTSIHKKRTEDDSNKHICLIGTYCVPGVLGKFFNSSVFQDAVHELVASDRFPGRRTAGAFVLIRNILMLSAGITNARRTGDLCNMTLQEFQGAWTSQTNVSDHIVHVLRHKTLASKACKVNFYRKLYRLVSLCSDRTSSCQRTPEGQVFWYIGQGGVPTPMSPSQFNRAIKRMWTAF